MHILWISFLACLIAVAASAPATSDQLKSLRELLEGRLKQQQTRQQDEMTSDVELNQKRVQDVWSKEDVELLLERLPENDVKIIREFVKLANRLNTARKLVQELNQMRENQKRNLDHPVSGFDPKYVGTREQDMGGDKKKDSAPEEAGSTTATSDQLERLRELLEGRLKQRQTRQQDEMTSDVVLNQKRVLDVWTKEEVELLFKRLPEKDVKIFWDFVNFANRLNTGRKLVPTLNEMKENPKRNLSHPDSGVDTKDVGTREQGMGGDKKKASAPEEAGSTTGGTNSQGDVSQWLKKPLSKAEIEKALSLIHEGNALHKRQDSEPIVTKNEKRPSEKSLEEAVLTALLVMENKNKQH